MMINIQLYQNSLKMQQNQVIRTSTLRPICPLPVYFSRSNTQNSSQQASRLFQTYCQYAKNGQILPIAQSNKNVFEYNKSGDFSNFNYKIEEGINIYNQDIENLVESLNTLKREQVLQKSGSKYRQQKSPYSKFLKRSTANDTKNIPKNFGKAIISFIQKNLMVVSRCIRKHNISLQNFIKELKLKKKILHSIRQLRALWMETDFIYAKPFRELSFYFLRRAGHRYIFGSRVADFQNHLKYRYRIMNAIKCPQTFTSIKI